MTVSPQSPRGVKDGSHISLSLHNQPIYLPLSLPTVIPISFDFSTDWLIFFCFNYAKEIFTPIVSHIAFSPLILMCIGSEVFA